MRCQTEICYINKYACVRVDWGFCINEARALHTLKYVRLEQKCCLKSKIFALVFCAFCRKW